MRVLVDTCVIIDALQSRVSFVGYYFFRLPESNVF